MDDLDIHILEVKLEKAEAERDEAHEKAIENLGHANRLERERDEARDALREIQGKGFAIYGDYCPNDDHCIGMHNQQMAGQEIQQIAQRALEADNE